MGYIPMDYVQLQRSVSCSDSRCLKLQREIKVSNFKDFLQFVPVAGSRELEGTAAKLGVEIYLLERVLRVGVVIVTSELR